MILSEDKKYLKILLSREIAFLNEKLKLELHPEKVSIQTLASGTDFLGWVNFPDHRVLRTTTKRRLLKRIKEHPTEETINSYLGLLRWGNTRKIKDDILKNL